MHCRQGWLFLKTANKNENKPPPQVANTEEQFIEQASRDATCPQRSVPAAFLRPQLWWQFLAPLECTGNESSTPSHSQKPWKRASCPPRLSLASSCSVPGPSASLLPPPTPGPSSGCKRRGAPGAVLCLLPQPVTVVPWPISYARLILLNLIHSVFMRKFTHDLVPLFLVILMLLCFLCLLRTPYHLLITTNQ